jgi:hypothetical protein
MVRRCLGMVIAGLVMSMVSLAGGAPAQAAGAQAVQSQESSATARLCQNRGRYYVARNYTRGPLVYQLKCGTKTWGYRHLVARKRWSATLDRKISSTIANGTRTSVGYSRFTWDPKACVKKERFRVVISDGPKGIITAYRVG